MTQMIIPEPVHVDNPRYAANHWDYPRRCADVDLAMEATRERVEEWDEALDPHGWWHERPHLIALYNEVWRLRVQAAQARRRRFWRRFWDVVTIIMCGVMLFAAGYLLGHAHIHEVVVYRAPVTVE